MSLEQTSALSDPFEKQKLHVIFQYLKINNCVTIYIDFDLQKSIGNILENKINF